MPTDNQIIQKTFLGEDYILIWVEAFLKAKKSEGRLLGPLSVFYTAYYIFLVYYVLASSPIAVIASALLFTIHHLIALRAQMDWTPALLGSLGVFVGGCAWSWCYRRYRSIWPGFVSHVLADFAVFAAGWHLLFMTRAGGGASRCTTTNRPWWPRWPGSGSNVMSCTEP